MMACPKIPAKINLKAKLDKDGNAGHDTTGDIVGTIADVKKGTQNVTIVLDKAVD